MRWTQVLMPILVMGAVAATTIADAQAQVAEYVVQPGDSLWGIARQAGCSQNEILLANPQFKDPKRLRPGMRIRVPACSGSQPATPRPAAARGAAPRDPCNWRPADIRTGSLDPLMRELGFRPPEKFRALVVRLELSPDRSRVVGRQLYDYGGLAARVDGWNPASTIKLYAAVSAIERLDRLGYGPDTTVTFHYPRGDKTFTLEKLFEDAVHWSNNLAHNRMVQLAGFDQLNGPNGTLKRAGLHQSAIMRAYASGDWVAEGHAKSLRAAPRITLRQPSSGRYKARKNTLPASEGKAQTECRNAACTSISDLGKMMCRLMLHEQLPAAHRLQLGKGATQGPMLAFLRQRLNRARSASDPIWRALESRLVPESQRGKPEKGGYQLFRKSGFSQDWKSDNFYIYQPHSRVRWIVVMAAYPGPRSLDQAADVIARIIKEDRVSGRQGKRTPRE